MSCTLRGPRGKRGVVVRAPLSVAVWALPAVLGAQSITLPREARSDSASLARAMATVAASAVRQYGGTSRDDSLNTVFRLQLLAGDAAAGLATLRELRRERLTRDSVFSPTEYSQYELFARAHDARAASTDAWRARLRREFLAMDARMGDAVAYRVAGSFVYDLPLARAQWERALAAAPTTLDVGQAVALARQYFVFDVYRQLVPAMDPVLRDVEARRYVIDEAARVPLPDGHTLTATVVRPRRLPGRQPAVLQYTIYASAQNRLSAIEMASEGFVGVVATARGKRGSTGPVRPWETEAADARALLTWISRQPWSNGAVGMMGGSYDGFTQWAAAGTLHPALKTIVPAAAVAPGIDFPRENGIVLNFQYSWAQYVGGNGLLDDASYRDQARWARLDSVWFARGTAYRALDAIDGVPNPLFRRWLDHPTYDAYWQAMIPQPRTFAQIAIPVLSITGYFDGAQPGALHYYRQHLAQRPAANHTLLIGPWDHFGAQRRPAPVLGDLRLDPVAIVDIGALTFAWMRHILRGAPRPAVLADRVNYQVIGTNQWAHAASLAGMSRDTLTLALESAANGARGGDGRLRADRSPAGDTAVAAEWRVDLTDRTTRSSTFIAMASDTALDRSNGVAFVGEPLSAPLMLSGAFTTELSLAVNARDVDLAVVLYERTADGQYRQLSYHLGRASLAADYTHRQLLTPNVRTTLSLRGARVVSRVVPAGSRLVVVVNVNKNAESQLNYGTGKDPSDETVRDAVEPLRVTLFGGSIVRVPLHAPMPAARGASPH